MSKSLFSSISPENIRQAIEEINRDGIRLGRQSSTYDVLVDGKRYPPKYLLSLANKYATGQELDHNQFEGGENTPAFAFLRDNGYQIVPKNQFTWVPFYRELCSKLLKYTPAELTSLVKQVMQVQNLIGLKDKDAAGNTVDLAEFGPYTFLSFISRGADEKRFTVLARLQEWLALTAPVPTDLDGLYTLQSQWVWMFGY